MPLSLIPPTLPEDYCNLTQQEQVNTLISGTQIVGVGAGGVITSNSIPGVNDRDKLWAYLRASGQFSGYIFKYQGDWLVEHEEVASGDARRLYMGTTTDLLTYDGGANVAVTDRTGPMWEVDTVFNGRSPMGPGAIPSSDPAKTLALAEQYGSGSVTLTSAQAFALQSHQHVLGRFAAITNDDGYFTFGTTTPPYADAVNLVGRPITGDTGISATSPLSALAGEYMISGEAYDPASGNPASSITNAAHQTTHPVVGCYLIKRTARIYRTPADT